MNHRRFYTNPFVTADNHDDAVSNEDAPPGSPGLSGDEAKSPSAPSPRKSKRGVKKRVVSVPIGDVEGSKSKGEAYPPSDSWAWRKYGQKPIKGSPYPRGYYRCSSSKGCPARKQVERSRVDPTMLLITYACDHNHAAPATKHHPSSTAAAASVASPASPSPTTSSSPPAKFSPEDIAVFSSDRFPPLGDDSPLLASEFGWLADISSTSLLHSPIYGASGCTDDDVSMGVFTAREDDEEESFFADLGELPECSMVFRRSGMEPDARDRRCSLTAIQCLGSTG